MPSHEASQQNVKKALRQKIAQRNNNIDIIISILEEEYTYGRKYLSVEEIRKEIEYLTYNQVYKYMLSLKKEGILKTRQQGKKLLYTLVYPEERKAIEYIKKHIEGIYSKHSGLRHFCPYCKNTLEVMQIKEVSGFVCDSCFLFFSTAFKMIDGRKIEYLIDVSSISLKK